MMVATSPPATSRRKLNEAPFHLGVLNCVMGFIAFVLACTIMGIPSYLRVNSTVVRVVGTAEGVWTGLLLIITGILGVLSVKRPSPAMHIASGAFGILSALVGLTGFIFSALGLLAYSFLAWNVTFISLYTVVGTMCLTGLPVGIVQAVYSFRNKEGTAQGGNAAFTPHGPHGSVAVSTAPTNNSTPNLPYGTAFFGIGIAEVTVGFVIIALHAAALSITRDSMAQGTDVSWLAFGYTGIGIWGGIYICVTGALGILYKSQPSVTLLNVNLAFTILAATTSIMIIIISGSAAVTVEIVLIPLHVVVAVFALASMIITVIHSAFCCGGVCRMENNEEVVVDGASNIAFASPAASADPPPGYEEGKDVEKRPM